LEIPTEFIAHEAPESEGSPSQKCFDFKHGLNYDWKRKGGIKTKSILIIEDEKDIADLIAYHLGQAGFSVAKALDGPSGLERAKKDRPGLIILDLMLPGMDGKDVCRALKSNPLTQSIPILMLTAKAEEMDRIVGFELGADDYVTKPFSPRELVLRVKAVLRREEVPEERGKRIQIDDLLIDIDRHQVSIKKNPIRLTSTEFKLLVELASRRGRVQTRDHLLDKVWGYTYEGYARTVDTHIRRLREKLGPLGDWIETIRGLGYRFREENE
jgi:two-component system phosphate regulon response regulator PhoB